MDDMLNIRNKIARNLLIHRFLKMGVPPATIMRTLSITRREFIIAKKELYETVPPPTSLS